MGCAVLLKSGLGRSWSPEQHTKQLMYCVLLLPEVLPEVQAFQMRDYGVIHRSLMLSNGVILHCAV